MKKNMWLNGMMGLVVGDALGCPVQFLTREEIRNRKQGPVVAMEGHGTYDMPVGTWTDDSSMALATLDSIIQNEAINLDDIMHKFNEWEVHGKYTPFGFSFDEGYTCKTALLCYRADADTSICGQTDEHSNGNGSLMRILPACLYYAMAQEDGKEIELSEAIKGVEAVSGLTHNHARSRMSCGIYYFMVRSIIEGIQKDKKTSLEALLQEGIDNGLKYYGRDISNLTEMAYLGRLFHLCEFKDVPEEQIRSTGYVIDSIEAAVWCLITTDSYKECMLKAVNLGNDTDTIAAIAGGLAGLYYGYEEIPKEWLAVIKKREWIEGMCEGLVTHEDIKAKVVDMHSHMLPRIDDGARNFEVTKQMIKMAYSEGCRHLFLTPHAGYLEFEDSEVSEKMAAVRKWIDEVAPAVQSFIEAGYTPIIAHAERYGMCFEELCYLKSLGCLLQMNICDLYYTFENDTNRMAHKLLKEKMFDFVGTDAHSIDRRPPKMKEYIDLAKKEGIFGGEETEYKLLSDASMYFYALLHKQPFSAIYANVRNVNDVFDENKKILIHNRLSKGKVRNAIAYTQVFEWFDLYMQHGFSFIGEDNVDILVYDELFCNKLFELWNLYYIADLF